jgi:hypothetical protein
VINDEKPQRQGGQTPKKNPEAPTTKNRNQLISLQKTGTTTFFSIPSLMHKYTRRKAKQRTKGN